MNKYTFEITLENYDKTIKTFEALKIKDACSQMRQYFKNKYSSAILLVTRNDKGRVLFEDKNYEEIISNFENDLSLKNDLLNIYESKIFKIAFISIVLAALFLGYSIGAIVAGR